MDWKTLLAYITGSVDQHLLPRNAYLVTENRFLRQQIKGRLRLSEAERKTLAEIGKKLGKQALTEVATMVKPDTILAWHRTLVAQENRSWGDDRIVGTLANLGFTVSDQTVGKVLRRHGIAPAPERKMTTTRKSASRDCSALASAPSDMCSQNMSRMFTRNVPTKAETL